MRRLFDDLRYAARSLRGSPWLALTAVVAMALGIGLTTTIYGVVDTAMLRGLPFPGGDRVVAVQQAIPSKGYRRSGVPIRDFLALAERQRALEGLAALDEMPMNLAGREQPVRVSAARVTANLFGLLRVRPALGRDLLPSDDVPGAPLVALISDDLWRDRFGADRSAIGRVVRMDGAAVTIVGVMPPRMRFPSTTDVWLPARYDRAAYASERGSWVDVVGRLRPGAAPDVAARELTAVQRAISAEHADVERDLRVEATPWIEAFMGGEDSQQLWTMLAAVLLVLVVACVNVANLLLARAAMRSREIGVRAALGASRRRVVALFLTESLALALAGAVGGIGLGWVGMRVFTRAVADTQPPFWIVLRMDARVLLFVAGATAIAAIVSGCLPALQAARADVQGVLKDGARGSSGFRVGRVSRALVIVELALSCGLLVGAGLMVSTISHLRTRDFGVDTRGTLTAKVMLPNGTDTAAVARFADAVLSRLRDAGVPDAAVGSALPVAEGSPAMPVHLEGEAETDGAPPIALRVAVTPGYFAALGAAPVRGRDVAIRDVASAPNVALVNDAFARARFRGENPIGRRLVITLGEREHRTVTIVGIAPDVFPGGTNERNVQQALYVPLAQWPVSNLSLMVHGRGDPLALARPLRAAVADVNPDLAVSRVGTLDAQIRDRTWFYRVFGGTFMVFGATALFLAALGLYAVMAASVTRRTREMGVRIALGAESTGIVRLVLRQGGIQVAIGCAAGLALGFALSQLLRGLLFGVKPGDPLVTLGVVAVLALTGLAACVVPALRAGRVDPITSLRAE